MHTPYPDSIQIGQASRVRIVTGWESGGHSQCSGWILGTSVSFQLTEQRIVKKGLALKPKRRTSCDVSPTGTELVSPTGPGHDNRLLLNFT